MAENKARLTIPDIESEADVAALQNELDNKSEILGVDVDPDDGEVEIRYDVDLISEEQIEEMVKDADYEIE